METTTTSAEQRLVELGIEIPPASQPLGAYTEVVESGRLLFVSGTIPTVAGRLQYTGTLGKELDLASGRQAAKLAALNALAAARQHLGLLDRVKRIVKTEVWLVTTDDSLLSSQGSRMGGFSVTRCLRYIATEGFKCDRVVTAF